MQQAAQLQAELQKKISEAASEASRGKAGTAQAIDAVRQSQELLNQALDAEAQAHKNAAASATAARAEVQQVLAQTQAQVDELTARLQQGLKLTIEADTARFEQALAELDKAQIEKKRLLVIQADLEQAEKQLREYEALLKEGKTLPVDADTSKARAALERLNTYAEKTGQIELKVATEKAQAAIANVNSQLQALDAVRTESNHAVQSNAAAVKAEVQSLHGMNTSSTHTIHVRKVEAHASGGLVGVARFATGGPVHPMFPRMAGGTVPGAGEGDTVPRTLDAGAFVLRKAAVRKYGLSTLAKLADVAHFAHGGPVSRGGASVNTKPRGPQSQEPPKRNREVVELFKMIELGLQGQDEYMGWLEWNYGAFVSLGARRETMSAYRGYAQKDRQLLEQLQHRKQLTSYEREKLEEMRSRWRNAMAQPLVYGKDLERDLIEYMEAHQGGFFARGGIAKSDTVPAMLTPGEFVVNKKTVSRLGVGFFDALNRLAVPAKALVAKVQGFAKGGLVQPLAGIVRAAGNVDLAAQLAAALVPMRLPIPATAVADPTPQRTVRVELVSGQRSVAATVDARDEARLLELLQQAKSRSF